ncbi:hypothetical protein PHYC_02164 [Phycisphaerales bacterium]|nr:hypothetical protein PHYC_02164 [Phycisphaerales bacterium]
MVAILLARRVVTLLPAPGNGDAQTAHQTAERVPVYGELARTWAWAAGLFEAGVVGSDLEGDSPGGDLGRVCEAIRKDERYSPLRAFVREADYESQRAYLEALSRDILKAGPDPGLSVPVVAALDRFAARCGAVVARPTPVSVAQRAELRLGREAFGFAMPVLLQADAGRIVRVREVLARELDELRDAIEGQPGAIREGGAVSGAAVQRIGRAAAGLAAAFESRREEWSEGAKDDEVRVVESVATVTGVVLPANAVLQSGVTAMNALCGVSAWARSEGEALPAVFDPVEGRFVLTLMVKVMGKR